MSFQKPFASNRTTDALNGQEQAGSWFAAFEAEPTPLVKLWMLYTLVPFLLKVVLPTLLTIVLLAPALVNLVDSRLPRFLVWDDILDNSSPTKDDHKSKGLPRWKQAGFVLLGLAGASLCAVDGVDQVLHGDVDSQGQLFGWAWYPVAQSIVLTFIWTLSTIVHPLLRPSPTPVLPTFAIHFSFLAAALLACALDFSATVPLASRTLATLAVLVALLALHLSLPVNSLPSNAFPQPTGIGGRSPEEESTLWNWVTLGFMEPLFKLGWGKKLDDEEVWKISPMRATGHSRRRWDEYREKHPDRSLVVSIFFLSFRGLLGDLICSIACIFLSYTAPYCMKQVLDAIEDPSPQAVRTAYVFAATAMGASVLKAILSGFSRRSSSGAEIRLRGALMSAIYAKALVRKDLSGVVTKDQGGSEGKKSDKKGQKETKDTSGASIGKVVSLMSNDVTRITNRITNASDLYSPPIEIVVASIFLYQLLGLSAFAGSIGLIALLPANSYLRERAVRINKGNVEARDRRMNVMNELVLSIKPLKLFAWEQRWTEKVLAARAEEMRWILKGRTNAVIYNFVWGLSPLLITLLSFWCFITLGHGQLTVSTAFTSLSLYQMLGGPLSTIPAQLISWAQSRLSIERLENFLDEPEVPDFVSSLRRSPTSKETDGKLGFEKATFRWVSDPGAKVDENAFQLGEIDIEFPKGKLTALSGPVGSGKSALLMSLLGELDCLSGVVHLPKSGRLQEDGLVQSIAYCAQNSFLRSVSIRDNIIFGETFDEERYDQVLFACALNHDLDNLEDGDLTEIGVRGVTLSGGQKARLAVARALYSKAAVCLFDDPLAALDVSTSRHLIEHGFSGPLMRGRTVVLASHHLDILLPHSDYLVKLHEGQVVVQGSMETLRSQGVLPLLVEEDEKEGTLAEDIPSETVKDEAFDNAVKEEAKRPTRKARQLVKAEERSEKNVSWAIYGLYIRSSGIALWALTVLLLCTSQGSSVFSRFWLKVWGEAYAQAGEGPEYFGVHLPSAINRPMFYLCGYAIISIAMLVISVIQISVSYLAAYRAATTLHDRLLYRVVKATMRTFDTIPGGRILNRFSADVAALDGNLAIVLRTTISWTASGITSVIVILAVEPWFSIPAVLLSLAYGRLSVKYSRTNRDLRRMMSTGRSPLFADFGECLDGLVTCRAFSSEQRFLKEFEHNVDLLLSKIYWNWASNRYLLVRFDVLGAFATFLSMLFAIAFSVSSGSSAMAILATQSFVSALYWLCRNISNMELSFNAVERVSEYLELPVEAPWVLDGHRPPAAWPAPAKGKPMIQVKDLVVKYDPTLPSVLHGITFDIQPGEKIGLIGRTASGKSTLALSLLRFTDPASGSITIDGIDISSIGVQDLRKNITYVPQDATLFKGDVRSNLDPFGEHTDVKLLDMLRRVHLISSGSATPSAPVSSAASISDPSTSALGSTSTLAVPEVAKKLEIHLDTLVSEGGANFSAGQRQLFALARALLRGNNIIVMDEASSAIDLATDDLIQATIREELHDATILTIAHRLTTVIDFDKLLVLASGEIAEFDAPQVLLAKEGGVLRTMAETSGYLEELLDVSRRSSLMGKR